MKETKLNLKAVTWNLVVVMALATASVPISSVYAGNKCCDGTSSQSRGVTTNQRDLNNEIDSAVRDLDSAMTRDLGSSPELDGLEARLRALETQAGIAAPATRSLDERGLDGFAAKIVAAMLTEFQNAKVQNSQVTADKLKAAVKPEIETLVQKLIPDSPAAKPAAAMTASAEAKLAQEITAFTKALTKYSAAQQKSQAKLTAEKKALADAIAKLNATVQALPK